MKNNYLIGAFVLVIIGGFLYSNSMEKEVMEGDAMMAQEGAMKPEGDAMMQGDAMHDDAMMVKESHEMSVALIALNNSGLKGTATIKDNAEGKAVVSIVLPTDVATAKHPAHIHVGSCATPGAVKYPLSAVVGGKSETVLTVSSKDILSGVPLMINVHKSAEEASVYVSCGDIVALAMEGGAMMQGEAMKGGEAMVKGEVMAAKPGSYIPYDATKLALAKTGKVVLDFRASWCPTCQALHKDITSRLNEIPANLTILDVDYDNSTALKQKYGVTYQHTFVQVDANGAVIKKWSGSPTLTALVAEVK